MARVRRWFLRHVCRHHGEVCDRCGRRCAIDCTYWFAPNWLFNAVEGNGNVMRCMACFTADAEKAGYPIGWTCGLVGYVEDWNDLHKQRGPMVAPEPIPVFREDDVRQLWEAMREITHVAFASDASMHGFAEDALEAFPTPEHWTNPVVTPLPTTGERP